MSEENQLFKIPYEELDAYREQWKKLGMKLLAENLDHLDQIRLLRQECEILRQENDSLRSETQRLSQIAKY
jgi:predicted  nucleic acid-binding Zn-ribbon protein